MHFEVTAFLTAAIGLLGLISFCLLVFGRLGVGSIIAFLVAGVLIELVRDIPTSTVLALRGVAEIGLAGKAVALQAAPERSNLRKV